MEKRAKLSTTEIATTISVDLDKADIFNLSIFSPARLSI